MRIRCVYTTLAVLCVALLLSSGRTGAFAQSDVEAKPAMNDLENVDELKEQFNKDSGKRRLLLLLSPT